MPRKCHQKAQNCNITHFCDKTKILPELGNILHKHCSHVRIFLHLCSRQLKRHSRQLKTTLRWLKMTQDDLRRVEMTQDHLRLPKKIWFDSRRLKKTQENQEDSKRQQQQKQEDSRLEKIREDWRGLEKIEVAWSAKYWYYWQRGRGSAICWKSLTCIIFLETKNMF